MPNQRWARKKAGYRHWGASTELITGCGPLPTSLNSLPMGCVTWLDRYFNNHELSLENFDNATHAAHSLLRQVIEPITAVGWEICMGASGTLQALYAIVQAQAMPEQITLETIFRIRSLAIQCGKLELLEIQGLTLERALVFPGGLAILFAIFEALSLENLALAGGALREGLIYSMVPPPGEKTARVRTVQSIQHRFLIDEQRAQRVKQLALQISIQMFDHWTFSNTASALLNIAIDLHEIS